MWFYNICIVVYAALIRLVSPLYPKARKWCDGRRGMMERLRSSIVRGEDIIWVHVASLGDFEQGRPVVDYIKENYPNYKILLTFFSPSGYEVRKSYKNADYVFYIPIDTKRNVLQFLDIVEPKVAIFVKYEFWLNMLVELRRRNIRTFIVSAIFRRNSIFFNPFGSIWRRALGAFETLFVQDEYSKQLLSNIGVTNVVVAGDTRFDRVANIAESAERVAVIEAFKSDRSLFVAGSTWGADEKILLPLIKANPEVKFVIAPHEIEEARIEHILSETKAVRYTQCEGADFADKQVLVLDTMGLLSRVYGSADWAYIGGGFGAGIHNTLEAVVYGLPIAFGRKYKKYKEARDLIKLGVARSVRDERSLQRWFAEVQDATLRAEIGSIAQQYVDDNRGATERCVKDIFRK